MSIVAIADTHAALWYLFADHRLSSTAFESIEAAAKAGGHIGVSAISVAEVVYLVEKKRLTQQIYDRLKLSLSDPDFVFVEVPFTLAIAHSMRSVSRSEVPDMPDRMIAATAVHLGLPVISRDGRIQSANLAVIW